MGGELSWVDEGWGGGGQERGGISCHLLSEYEGRKRRDIFSRRASANDHQLWHTQLLHVHTHTHSSRSRCSRWMCVAHCDIRCGLLNRLSQQIVCHTQSHSDLPSFYLCVCVCISISIAIASVVCVLAVTHCFKKQVLMVSSGMFWSKFIVLLTLSLQQPSWTGNLLNRCKAFGCSRKVEA